MINWLLEAKNPSIQYRTYTELLDLPINDEKVIKAKNAVLDGKNVKSIFNKLNENGLFPHLPKYYGNFTTFTYLEALAELGIKKDDPYINHIVDWILTPGEDKFEHFIQKEFQNENAYLLDESNIGSCKQLLFLSALVKMGFLDDVRVQRLLEAVISKSRFDGGYLCKWKKSRIAGQIPKSCYTSTLAALKLFAELPETYHHCDAYENLIEYFISRNVIYSKVNPTHIISDIESGFSAVGTSDIFTLAYSMSKLGYGNNVAMNDLWEIIDTKINSEGKVLLEKTESKKTITMEPIGGANSWLTLYLLLCRKYKDNVKYSINDK